MCNQHGFKIVTCILTLQEEDVHRLVECSVSREVVDDVLDSLQATHARQFIMHSKYTHTHACPHTHLTHTHTQLTVSLGTTMYMTSSFGNGCLPFSRDSTTARIVQRITQRGTPHC